jgi:sortase A
MTARAQTALKAEFHRSLRHADRHHDRSVPGRADGLILIPALHVDAAFVEGIAPDDLAKGPGHYPNSPMPGRGGNVAIAGHRTTHGAPFWSLDSLREGDDITLITRKGRFVYRVQWVKVASPYADWVVGGTKIPSLTLTTCWPRFSASHRFVVRAVQVYGKTSFGFIDHRAGSLQTWTRPPSRRLGHSLR